MVSTAEPAPEEGTSDDATRGVPAAGVVVPIQEEMYKVLPQFGVMHSFRAAFVGVARTVASQRNMKLHILSAEMVAIVAMALPLDLSMRVALLFAIALVFFAEILNTGLEALVDLFIGEYHRLAMLAKDAAAAGVLVLAVTAVLVFADIVWSRWELVTSNLDQVANSVMFGVPLVISEAVGLFLLRRGPLGWLRLAASVGLLVPLVQRSLDPVFSIYIVGMVLLAAYARHAFPSSTGRGAPRKTADTPSS
jgi:diacylglycerol kinase (ATP)